MRSPKALDGFTGHFTLYRIGSLDLCECMMISTPGEVLAGPLNFSIANISSTTASLHWEFSKPSNGNLQDVIFWITVVQNAKIVGRNESHQSKEPRASPFDLSRTETQYTVELHAESVRFQESCQGIGYYLEA